MHTTRWLAMHSQTIQVKGNSHRRKDGHHYKDIPFCLEGAQHSASLRELRWHHEYFECLSSCIKCKTTRQTIRIFQKGDVTSCARAKPAYKLMLILLFFYRTNHLSSLLINWCTLVWCRVNDPYLIVGIWMLASDLGVTIPEGCNPEERDW